MGVTIEGSDGGSVNLAADATQTDPVIKSTVTSGGTTLDVFALEPAGQLRVAADLGDAAAPFAQGLKLVGKFGAGGSDFDIDDDTNSVNLVVGNTGLGHASGKHEIVVPSFTTNSAGVSEYGVLVAADKAISNDVANGWIVDRTLRATTLQAVGQLDITDDPYSPTTTVSIAPGLLVAETISTPGIISSRIAAVGTSGTPPSAGGVGSVDATSQSASIASTNLSNSVSGAFLIYWYLECTATQGGAATVQLGITHTDDVGANTQNSTALTLTAGGRDRGVFNCYVASGNITYAATVVGAVTTGRYALRLRAFFLN